MDSYRRPHAEPDYAADAPACAACGTVISAADYWRDGLCVPCSAKRRRLYGPSRRATRARLVRYRYPALPLPA